MENVLFEVVKNEEGQYSIWQVGRAVPDGWNKVGKCDVKEACLEYIKEHWVDMRPLSLKNTMESESR